MSKQSEIACTFIGAGVGMRAFQTELLDDSNTTDDINLHLWVAQFGAIAAEMIDAAYGITFAYPDQWQDNIYNDFGYWLAGEINWDGDEFILPEVASVLKELQDFVFNAFKDVAVESQTESLKSVLTQVRENAA